MADGLEGRWEGLLDIVDFLFNGQFSKDLGNGYKSVQKGLHNARDWVNENLWNSVEESFKELIRGKRDRGDRERQEIQSLISERQAELAAINESILKFKNDVLESSLPYFSDVEKLLQELFMEEKKAESIKLQPLRIPSGWKVITNSFYNIDPTWDIKIINCDGVNIYDLYFTEDLFHAQQSNLGFAVDLGWYPDGDKNGKYRLLLIKVENGEEIEDKFKWDCPIVDFESRSKQEIIEKLESVMEGCYQGRYDHF